MLQGWRTRAALLIILGAAGYGWWNWQSAAAEPATPVKERRPPLAPEPPPEGELGDMIRLGGTLVSETSTHPLTREYVGNALNCRSCHLEPHAAPFIGVATAYPAWSPREQRVVTLEDRIGNCFMRSCNGTRPPLGSRPIVAIAAYITWVSNRMPIQMNSERAQGPYHILPLERDPKLADGKRGEILYASKCQKCHGGDGSGTTAAPPVWGNDSYNTGAGLSNNLALASWLKVAMPRPKPNLTEAEALDIAAFVNSHPRPVFRLREHLPSPDRLGEYNGEIPPDAQAP
ncbi:MAG TPA: c-type cytochrome [Planctomycetaceae bacterium]|nr:c-type cytochrome [Planctomycetaceae bacterium]